MLDLKQVEFRTATNPAVVGARRSHRGALTPAWELSDWRREFSAAGEKSARRRSPRWPDRRQRDLRVGQRHRQRLATTRDKNENAEVCGLGVFR
jgi:hypothetical protein